MTTATPSPSDIASSPALFAKHFLKIMDKRDEIIPLRHNTMQARYLANRTPRDLILKARQIGFSTAIQGEMFRYAVTRPARTLTLANDDDNTQKMRRMADRFYNNLPENFRPERALANASITTYPGYGSEAMIATAGNKNAGRSGSYRFMHMSEVAFYPDAQSTVASAMQGGTPLWVAAESTPNGAQGWFYETCMEALDGNSAWKIHFFAWFDNPEYQLPLDDGETITYSSDELELIRLHKLTAEQIKWRRVKQKELKHLFIQEYPEDPKNCFLTSGLGYFGNIDHVFEMSQDTVYDPAFRYVAGLDFGQQNDYTVCSIMDATNGKQVALLRINKLPWSEMRRQVIALCKRWNVGYLLAEKNSMGSTNIEELNKEAEAIGFSITVQSFDTTNASKNMIMSAYREALHEGGLLLINDPDQKREHRAFAATQLPSGDWRLAAPDKEHDDTVIAGALSWHAVVFGGRLETIGTLRKVNGKWLKQVASIT